MASGLVLHKSLPYDPVRLAVSTPKRAALLPNVPALAEAGYHLCGVSFWVGGAGELTSTGMKDVPAPLGC